MKKIFLGFFFISTLINSQENGYCLSLGDWDKMVNAVPFRLQDGKTMCLSIGGPSYLVTPQMVTESFAPQLVHVVRDIINMGV